MFFKFKVVVYFCVRGNCVPLNWKNGSERFLIKRFWVFLIFNMPFLSKSIVNQILLAPCSDLLRS